jgi:hypothetical protein
LFVQEFDLRPGATRIGRSAGCEITIDDPSISREHAEIVVDDRGACIRDLGSRNGVRVNGARITGETTLRDGDRIGIGQQDLVLNADVRERNLARTSRMTAVQPPRDRASWWMALHAELADKAMANGRLSEAEQAIARVDEACAAAILCHQSFPSDALEPVLSSAVRLSAALDRPRWLTWSLETLRAFRITPTNALVAQLETAPAHLLDDARVALASYVAEMRDSSPSLEGLAAIAEDLSSSRRLVTTDAVEVPHAG